VWGAFVWAFVGGFAGQLCGPASPIVYLQFASTLHKKSWPQLALLGGWGWAACRGAAGPPKQSPAWGLALGLGSQAGLWLGGFVGGWAAAPASPAKKPGKPQQKAPQLGGWGLLGGCKGFCRAFWY
jgi:hypothetical protein